MTYSHIVFYLTLLHVYTFSSLYIHRQFDPGALTVLCMFIDRTLFWQC